MVTLELVPEVSPMFFLPGGKLHLTLESPGPVKLDPSILTEQEKNWINNAALTGKLKIEGDEAKKASSTLSNKQEVVKQAETSKKVKQEVINPRIEERKEQANKLLKLPIAALKSKVESESDISLLKALVECENLRTKPRLSVLKCLNTRLHNLIAKLNEKLGGVDVEGKYCQDPVRANADIVSEVTEVEEKQIEIRPVREDD